MLDAWLSGIGCILGVVALPAVAIWLTWPGTPGTLGVDRAERWLIALSLPITAFVVASELLARLGLLTRAAVWGYAAAAVAVAIGVIVCHRGRARDRWGRFLHLNSFVHSLAAAAALVAACSAEALLAIRRADSFTAPTSWYYWQLSVDISRHGNVPTWAHEWGTTVRFFDYHLGFSAMGAALGLATGHPHALVAAQIIRILTVVGTVFGIALFARVLGAPRLAAVAAGIAIPCVIIINTKLASFRPESTAYLLMLIPPALLYRWLSHGGRARLAALIIAFVGVSQLHTPAAVVSITLCVAIALVHLKISWRFLGSIVGVFLMMGISWFGVDAITGHRGPFSSGFADPPALTRSGADPTYAFNQLAIGTVGATVDELSKEVPSSAGLLRRTMSLGFAAGGTSTYTVAMILFGLLAVGAIATRRWDIGRLVLATVIAVGALIGAAYITSLSWSTFVPLRTGYGRLLQIWWFAPIAVIALIPMLSADPRFRKATTVGLVALTVTLWGFSVAPTRAHGRLQPPQATLRSLRRLHLSHTGTVLTNTYTQDFVRYNTGADGLLDGRAPYIEAGLLRRANQILIATSQYLANPGAHPFPFAKYHVKYVLIGTAPSALGNSLAFPTDIGMLRYDQALTTVKQGPGYTLFAVQPRAA